MVEAQKGFLPLFRNRNFMLLWSAQAVALTAYHGIQFVQIVLIEKLTRSSIQIAIMILAFTLPAVFFSPLAGVVVDRLPKAWVLVASNALRTVIVLGYILALRVLPEGLYLLLAIYILTFLASAIGQFFVPAEVAALPLVVGKGHKLLSANALFNLTLIVTQMAGLVILAPLAVKILGVPRSFLVIGVMYLLATLLVFFIPRDVPRPRKNSQARAIRRVWEEIMESWRFVTSHHPVYLAILQSSLVITLILIMALLAPGFATRVLHLPAEDAVLVFAPAGIGVFLTIILMGRFGHLVPRQVLTNGGLLALALTLLILTWVSGRAARSPDFPVITMVSLLSFFLGAEMAAVNIPAQTLVQERTPEEMRGRVLALYFMFANGIGILPMLTIGAAADTFGILPVMAFVATIVLLLAVASAWRSWRYHKLLLLD
ncbi:MAG: MFS transporter [Chloroflexi bacterium]|nr:MFS transporter [Chloroflexota bacterium]